MENNLNTVKMKRTLNFIYFSIIVSVVLMACGKSNPLSPGVEYMPDMYYSEAAKPYEWLNNGVFKDSLQARKPVDGTISQGAIANSEMTIDQFVYPYANTPEGYELAGTSLLNPIQPDSMGMKKGEELYTKFCVHCHGANGDGQGSIVANGKFPSPGTYWSKVGLTEGKMFHSITFGKGMMGAHSSQVTKTERWLMVNYIKELINKNAPKPAAPAAAVETKTSNAGDSSKPKTIN
jgi:mono/diheme cytochrome c family protein